MLGTFILTLAVLAASSNAFTSTTVHQRFGRFSQVLEASTFADYDITSPNTTAIAFEDTVVGKGPVAEKGNLVSVAYSGSLLSNGNIFDSNSMGIAFTLGEGEVIKGWEQGIEGMKVGGKRTLKIPPNLAYGERGMDNLIPANSHLQFEVELLKIPKPGVETLLAQSPGLPFLIGLILFGGGAIALAPSK